MSSPWKKKQPEVVVDAVLKRAEVGKVQRDLYILQVSRKTNTVC